VWPAIGIFWLGFLFGCVCCGWSPRFLDTWARRRERRRQQATEARIIARINADANRK
jgi:hypothetical protein